MRFDAILRAVITCDFFPLSSYSPDFFPLSHTTYLRVITRFIRVIQGLGMDQPDKPSDDLDTPEKPGYDGKEQSRTVSVDIITLPIV